MLRKSIHSIIAVILGLCFLPLNLAALKKPYIVTTNTTLESVIKEIVKENADVVSLSRAEQDLHYIEPRPSFVVHLRRADMLVIIGMELDMWVESLIDASRNPKITYNAIGYVDTSVNIDKLGVPQGRIDASMGHLHAQGNPHFHYSPNNIPVIAASIYEGLKRVDPANEGLYKKNLDNYLMRFNKAFVSWQSKMDKLENKKIVAYHESWEYFANDFGLEIIGHLEPKPGIPPSPAHVNAIIERIKSQNVGIIIQETFYPQKTGRMVAGQTKAKLVVLPSAVGEMGTKDTIGLFNKITDMILK